MTDELKQWDDEKPDAGKFINLYRSNTVHAVFCRVVQHGFFRAVEGSQVGDQKIPIGDEMWCYVPAPPDWDLLLTRRRAETVRRAIERCKAELAKFEAESEALAKERGKGES